MLVLLGDVYSRASLPNASGAPPGAGVRWVSLPKPPLFAHHADQSTLARRTGLVLAQMCPQNLLPMQRGGGGGVVCVRARQGLENEGSFLSVELRLLVAFRFDQYSSSSTMRKPRELWQTGALLLGGQLQGGTSEVHPRDRVLGLPGWTRARPGCHRMESCQVCEGVASPVLRVCLHASLIPHRLAVCTEAQPLAKGDKFPPPVILRNPAEGGFPVRRGASPASCSVFSAWAGNARRAGTRALGAGTVMAWARVELLGGEPRSASP